MEKKFNYEAAVREIEQIEAAIERGDMGLDDIARQLARATELIKQCKAKLAQTDEEVRAVLQKEEDE